MTAKARLININHMNSKNVKNVKNVNVKIIMEPFNFCSLHS